VYNMYTDLEGILSACLCLHVSFYPGVVNFRRYAFPQSPGQIQINRKKPPPKNIKVTPAVWVRYSSYPIGWISMKTSCRLGFCQVSTFNSLDLSKSH
jgi:hypothetical protein